MQRVIFRKWKSDGSVIAFFLDQPDWPYVMSYEHIGQHGHGMYPNPQTEPATAQEYASLLNELKQIGYDDLRIVKRGRPGKDNLAHVRDTGGYGMDSVLTKSQKPLYQVLARLVGQYKRCCETNNREWKDRFKARIEQLVKQHLPYGSGFDSGTTLNFDWSTEANLRLETAYHHMIEHGYYDGWTEHTVSVRANLAFDFVLTISGNDRNEVKELIHQEFDYALRQVVDEFEPAKEEAAS